MKELWEMLVSAQENASGIPSAILEEKKEQIRKEKVSWGGGGGGGEEEIKKEIVCERGERV